MSNKVVGLLLLVSLVLSSCATMVRIDTNVPAKVTINGQPAGTTPVQKSLSDFIGTNYDVVLTADGYETYRGRLQKEFKVGNFIGGLFVWPILLWTYGPAAYQVFELIEK